MLPFSVILATRAVNAAPNALVLDLSNHTIWQNGRSLFHKNYVLSRPVTFRVIAALLAAAPKPVMLNELVDFVWGDDEDGGPDSAAKCIDVAIHKVRPVVFALGCQIVRRHRVSIQIMPLPAVPLARAA